MGKNSFDLAFEVEVETSVIEIGDFDMTIKSAGSDNKAWTKAFLAYNTKYGRKIESGVISDKEANRMVSELIVEHLVVGWDGVQQEQKGKWVDLPYTKESCLEMLIKYPIVANTIISEGQKASNFKKEKAEEIAKK